MTAPKKDAVLLGDFVRYVIPEDRQKDAFARGRVVMVETFTDFHGSRVWLYVNWFDHDGKPSNEATKHAAAELELVEGAE